MLTLKALGCPVPEGCVCLPPAQAANQGSRFKDRRLQISWHKPKVPSVSTEVEEEESKEEV